MRTETMTVTPALAAEWLKRNNSNRQHRLSYVRQLADAMRRGEWELTHQGIAFGTDGDLKDGQHRLMAVVESGVSIKLCVTRDVEVDAIRPAPIDLHAKRNMADILGGDRKAVEVGTLAAKTCEGTRLTPLQVRPYIDAIAPLAAKLMDSCSSTAKGRSTAGVRLGAVLNMPRCGTAVCDQYRALVLLQYDEMVPSVQALLRQLDNGEYRRADSRLIAARAYRAFDLASSAVTRIQLPKESPTSALRDAILDLMTGPEAETARKERR